MSAGTLTLTNNSASVGGSGTAFATELAAGDFIVATVGGITYTLPVKSLESATSLTLVSKYLGPTQSGVAWSAVPRAAQNQITAALVAQTTEALRGLNSDKQNWQAVFSDSGDITVILPDGTSFTGPSWKKISDILADIDPAGLQQIADQVSADAQQVATDRQDVDAKAAQASSNAATAAQAATNATAANTTAQQAKTDAAAANTAAQQAKTDAQAAAASINPDNLLNKNNNLSDVVSATTAVGNLGLKPIGTSGDTIPLLSGNNTWSSAQTFTDVYANRVIGAYGNTTQFIVRSNAATTAWIEGQVNDGVHWRLGKTSAGTNDLALINYLAASGAGSYFALLATGNAILSLPTNGQLTVPNNFAMSSAANQRIFAGSAQYLFQTNGTGQSTGGWQSTSDRRIKKRIQPITNAWSVISAVTGYTFEKKWQVYTPGSDEYMQDAGFIAQELEPVLPYAVGTTDGYTAYGNDDQEITDLKSVDYTKIVPYLVELAKEQQARIDALEAKLADREPV